MRFLICLIVAVVLSSCAKVEKQTITIATNPQGADITITDKDPKTGSVTKNMIGISPVDYTIIPVVTHNNFQDVEDDNEFSSSSRQEYKVVNEPRYTFLAKKEGYFSEEKALDDYDQVLKTGSFMIKLHKSPMWWATTESLAANRWINLIVNSKISNSDMWQRVVDAVTKRYSDLNKYDFKSGYLSTIQKIKTYKTARGTFLLSSKFIATIMENDPLTYRIKLESKWASGDGVTWYPYPRVFTEDAELITELMSRFQAY